MRDIIHYTINAITIILIICIISIPFLWLDGRAKADYLKQSQNIDLPWHKACFLKVNATGIGANINYNKEK